MPGKDGDADSMEVDAKGGGEAEETIFPFPPEPSTSTHPEPQPQPYSLDLFPASKPIVIDCGSFQTRAGWAGEKEPSVVFRSLVGKARTANGDTVNLAGNQLICRDISKTSLRSPFERDVVQHLDSFETLMDYTFIRLGINTDRLYHPVLLTETLNNPSYTRGVMSEVLFECYSAPSVAYAVDSLLTYDAAARSTSALGSWSEEMANGLIVRVGHAAAHILPVVDGVAVPSAAFRSTMAGAASSSALHQLLHLRYPQHKQAVTHHKVQFLKEQHCRVVEGDYGEELAAFAAWETLQPKLKRFQLPYTEKEVPVQSAADLERRNRQRQEQAERLREMARAKREARMLKFAADIRKLHHLHGAKSREMAGLQEKAAGLGITDLATIPKAISALVRQLQELKAKHRAKGFTLQDEHPDLQNLPMLEEDASQAEASYPLLGIPDDKLTPEEREKKRHQKMLKGAADARNKERERKERERDERLRKRSQEEQERAQNPTKWLQLARAKRAELLERREARAKKKAAASDRRSQEANERMKAIISTLSGAEEKKKTADGCADDGSDFGENDDDWNVYRQIAREESSDSEEEAKLAELDALIIELDPSHVPAVQPGSEKEQAAAAAAAYVPTARDFQLVLGTELIQTGEVLFQPAMVGGEHGGLAELIASCLRRFDPAQRRAMGANVMVCGGGGRLPGLLARVQREVRAVLHPEDTVKVWGALDPAAAWRGGASLAAMRDFESLLVTRQEWEEKGPSYLKEHRCSNRFIADRQAAAAAAAATAAAAAAAAAAAMQLDS